MPLAYVYELYWKYKREYEEKNKGYYNAEKEKYLRSNNMYDQMSYRNYKSEYKSKYDIRKVNQGIKKLGGLEKKL